MDVNSELRAAIRRTPQRLLLIGAWEPDLDFAAGERHQAPRLDAVDPEVAGVFDLVLWRLPPSWNDRLLEHAARLLADRGRLWLIASASHRRRLVMDLGRLGYAILDERSLPDLHLLETRHDGFVVRAYEAGDEADILRLFAPSFHVQRSLEHWRWKYLENPWGRLLITLARSQDGELAAHYAGYPVPFYLVSSRETLLALQIGDTMTDPRFRRAGRGVSSLLGRCFRHFFARNCDEKIAFNFGFNTGTIRRFNFQFIKGRLGQKIGYWRRGPQLPESAGYQVTEVERAGAGFDRFFHRVAKHYGFLVRRDAAWLDWRYLRCPDAPPFRVYAVRHLGRLVAWSVFRRRPSPEGDQLLWVDALIDPRHTAAAADLLLAALSPTDGHDALREVVAWFPERPGWWSQELRELGFEPADEPNDLALIYLPFTHPEVDQLLPDAYYTMGDGDLA